MKKFFPFFFVSGTLAAHTGHNAAHVENLAFPSFLQGFLHPLLGIDHLLLFLALGVYLGLCLKRTRFALRSILLLGALVGNYFALVGLAGNIALIVISSLVGLLLLLPVKPVFAMLVSSFFVIFHAVVHSATLPHESSMALFIIGMAAASLLILLAAFFLSRFIRACSGGLRSQKFVDDAL